MTRGGLAPNVPKIPDRDEYRQKWATLDSPTRRRIVAAVNRGRALDDPREAALAVATAERQQRFWRKAWLLGPVAALLTASQGLMTYLANAVLSTLILGVMALFWHRRAERAAAANREAAQAKRNKKRKKPADGAQAAGGSRKDRGAHLPGRRRKRSD